MFKTRMSKGKGIKAFERNVTSLPEDDMFKQFNDSEVFDSFDNEVYLQNLQKEPNKEIIT